MHTQLKICGVTGIDDAGMLVEEGVDFIGFNFYPNSARYINPERAQKVIEQITGKIRTVGILVQPTLEEVYNTLNLSKVDFLQIYEPRDFISYHDLPLQVIAAYRLSKHLDDDSITFNGADMILIDSYSENSFGGTGRTFDWNRIPAWIPREKLVLAGGINPNNVADALQQVRPAVIDVASGAEFKPGEKDRKKVRDLVTEIKRHNSNK